MPHSILSLKFTAYEFQVQDFQYFVVIDFEGTCDKGKNPHPQEIMESCFLTDVRPTCNPILSDFCKDLSGIQKIQVC